MRKFMRESWVFGKRPDLGPLHQALARCGIGADLIPGVAERLTRPPLSFAQSASDDPEIFPPGGVEIYPDIVTGTWEATARGFDPGVAARMLQLHEGRPNPKREWKPSRNEWKRARELWNWTGKAHGLSVTRKGRPPLIDAALVLYCVRVLCEATGRRQFPRLPMTDRPTGPMWRALSEALPLAELFLARCYGGYRMPAVSRRISTKVRDSRKIDARAQGIAEIIGVIRSAPFNHLCRKYWLGPTSDDVTINPAMLRVVIARARNYAHKKINP